MDLLSREYCEKRRKVQGLRRNASVRSILSPAPSGIVRWVREKRESHLGRHRWEDFLRIRQALVL